MSTPAFYWLVSAQVVTVDRNAVEYTSRPLNVLVVTHEHQFTRKNMAQAHQAILQRFVAQIPQIKGRQIADVVFSNINPLGYMLPSAFHEGFPEAEQPEKLQS